MTYKVLLVDDDEGVRAVVARMLQGDGHTVTTAENGQVGLRVMETEEFDLVITDVVMPEVEGIEVIRRLRRMAKRPKVIVMSGGGRGPAGGYLTLALHLGADTTLAKPIGAAALRTAISNVMSGGAASQRAE